MSGLIINKDNLRQHGKLFVDKMSEFSDDSVEFDSNVCFAAYTDLKNSKTNSTNLRKSVVDGTTKEVGNINYLVNLMESVDNGAVSAAEAFKEE